MRNDFHRLTERGRWRRLGALATTAAAQYPDIRPETVRLLHGGWNTTFRVLDHSGARYALRVARVGLDADEVAGEIAWLEALAHDTDLAVVTPVRASDGRSVVTMPVSEAGRRLRGKAGTQTTVTIQRDGGPVRDVALTRAEVIVPNVKHRVLDGSVGYIRIENVSQKTVYNMIGAMEELKTVGALEHGLVLDLRGNTGGSMKEK